MSGRYTREQLLEHAAGADHGCHQRFGDLLALPAIPPDLLLYLSPLLRSALRAAGSGPIRYINVHLFK
jgi:hypothetical protein